MSVWGYIAGTLIAPNLTGYLISKGLTSKEEKRLVKDIETKIIDFNRKFDDTEVDSNYFVDFLEQSDINEMIFERVFNSYKSLNTNFGSLSSLLGQEAVEYVNKKKGMFAHPHVKTPSDFKEYFVELFKSLVCIRESLLSINEKGLASIINESISTTEEKIIQEIDKKLGDDYLLENKIKEIELLIDKGLNDNSLELISDVFSTVTNISNQQRVKLLYQKARVYINTDKYEKVQDIKQNILHFSSESKYLDEIDYWVGCHHFDKAKVEKSIEQLRKKGVCDEELKLKMTNYHLMQEEYDIILREICDGGINVSVKYSEYASAYYQAGIVNVIKGQFDIAVELFKKALEKKYNIVYEYNYVMTSAIRLLKQIKNGNYINEAVMKEAEALSVEFEKVRYFIFDGPKEARLHYWWNYLNLLGLFNHSRVIDEYVYVDKELCEEEPIAIVISEAYYLNKDFSNALPFLEKIWKLDSLFLSRLMHTYSELNRWDLIGELFKKDIGNLFDSEGNIFFYKVELLQRQGDVAGAIEAIRHEGRIYNLETWFQKRVLQFAHETGLTELYDEYVNYILINLKNMNSDTKINLVKTLFNHDKFQLVREVLKLVYKHSQEAIEMYLHSFGGIDPKNENFDILREAVKELYEEGNRSSYLLQSKFYIEFFTHRYNDAMSSLMEYRESIERDTFYNLNIVQNTILGCLDYDASEECNYLLNMDILKYHIMAAQYLGYKGRWHEAKVQLSNSFYKFSEQINEEEITGFFKVYFVNMHQNTSEVEYSRACDDSAIILMNEDGVSKRICIQSNDSIIHQNGEEKLECINYKSSSDEALMFKALAKKGAEIEFENNVYHVKEILNIHTYHFRCFFQRLLVEFPDNKTLIQVAGESIEGLVEKMSEIMAESQKSTKRKLDFYNFEIQTGVPISYLSNSDNGKYLEVIDYLLNDSNQNFYSSYSTREIKDSKYVLTISSIFILNSLGLLDKLNSIKSKLIVTPSIKSFIRKGLDDSIKYDAVVSTAYIDENEQFRMIESTESNKEYRRRFWAELLLMVNSIEVVKPNSINSAFYDKLHEITDVSEFESISIVEEKDSTLVCDDLFIAKLSESINKNSTVLNAIGLIYVEELLSFDELLDVILRASKYKIINAINHSILYDIYLKTANEYGTEVFSVHYPILLDIFNNLFNESTKGINQNLYQKFTDVVMRNGKMSGLLYKLLEKPLSFKPYEEFIADSLKNMKIECEIAD